MHQWMTRVSRTLGILALAILLPITAGGQEKPPLMTVLTAPDAETQMMAMVLTTQARAQGAPVRVMLCGPAGDLALLEPSDEARAPQGPRGVSPRQLLEQLVSGGVTVEVCAIYLPNRGLDSSALMDGVGTARPPELAEALLGEDVRILSF